MQYDYHPVDQAWKTKFLTSQADNLCLAVRPATGFLTQFVLGSLALVNNTGNPVAGAIAGRLPLIHILKEEGVTIAGEPVEGRAVR